MWIKVVLKTAKRIKDLDIANPITQDTLSIVVDIAKEVIKPF